MQPVQWSIIFQCQLPESNCMLLVQSISIPFFVRSMVFSCLLYKTPNHPNLLFFMPYHAISYISIAFFYPHLTPSTPTTIPYFNPSPEPSPAPEASPGGGVPLAAAPRHGDAAGATDGRLAGLGAGGRQRRRAGPGESGGAGCAGGKKRRPGKCCGMLWICDMCMIYVQ